MSKLVAVISMSFWLSYCGTRLPIGQQNVEVSDAVSLATKQDASFAEVKKSENGTSVKAPTLDFWQSLLRDKKLLLRAKSNGGQRLFNDDQSMWKNHLVYREIGNDEVCQITLSVKQHGEVLSYNVIFESKIPSGERVGYFPTTFKFENPKKLSFFSQREFVNEKEESKPLHDEIFFDEADNSLSFKQKVVFSPRGSVVWEGNRFNFYLELSKDRSKIISARMSFVPTSHERHDQYVSFIDCGEFD